MGWKAGNRDRESRIFQYTVVMNFFTHEPDQAAINKNIPILDRSELQTPLKFNTAYTQAKSSRIKVRKRRRTNLKSAEVHA